LPARKKSAVFAMLLHDAWGGGRVATLAKCTLDIYCPLIYYVKLNTVADSIFIDGGGGAQ
jgi:hypothetical protein